MREFDINALTGVELVLTCECNKTYSENDACISSEGLTFCSERCVEMWENRCPQCESTRMAYCNDCV